MAQGQMVGFLLLFLCLLGAVVFVVVIVAVVVVVLSATAKWSPWNGSQQVGFKSEFLKIFPTSKT